MLWLWTLYHSESLSIQQSWYSTLQAQRRTIPLWVIAHVCAYNPHACLSDVPISQRTSLTQSIDQQRALILKMHIYGIVRLWTDKKYCWWMKWLFENVYEGISQNKAYKRAFWGRCKDEFENYAPKCKKVNLGWFVVFFIEIFFFLLFI